MTLRSNRRWRLRRSITCRSALALSKNYRRTYNPRCRQAVWGRRRAKLNALRTPMKGCLHSNESDRQTESNVKSAINWPLLRRIVRKYVTFRKRRTSVKRSVLCARLATLIKSCARWHKERMKITRWLNTRTSSIRSTQDCKILRRRRIVCFTICKSRWMSTTSCST